MQISETKQKRRHKTRLKQNEKHRLYGKRRLRAGCKRIIEVSKAFGVNVAEAIDSTENLRIALENARNVREK